MPKKRHRMLYKKGDCKMIVKYLPTDKQGFIKQIYLDDVLNKHIETVWANYDFNGEQEQISLFAGE